MSDSKSFEEIMYEFGQEFGPFGIEFFPSNDPYHAAWTVWLFKGTHDNYEVDGTGWAGFTAEGALSFAAEELRKKA